MINLFNDDIGGLIVASVSAILPAFNEEVAIGSVVLRARKYADRVIVVDDGSSDRTAEVAKLAGAEVIRHPVNRGKGAALKTGFGALNDRQDEAYLHLSESAGLKSDFLQSSLNRTNVIVTIDTDGQHDPADIPKLIEPILIGEADMVNGSRYLNGNKKDTPLYRRLGQVVLDTATNLGSGLSVTDSQSGFRAYASRIKDIFQFKQNGLAIESEMLSDAAEAGLRIKEVEIGVRYDVGSSSENPVSHGVRILVKVLHDMELRRPLFYFTAPGLVMAVVGFGMGMEFLRAFYHGGNLQYGPTMLMILLMIVGCFMAFTGIILHTISLLLISESNREYHKDLNFSGMRKNKYRDSVGNPARDK
jgi:glycosyltransferase involved in cell wall biosynthesis